jgi:hypothetical protein
MRTYSKAVSAAVAAAALAAVTLASPASAAVEVTIKVEVTSSETMSTEVESQFSCPANQVLTGRTHVGDENRPTTYHCSTIFINGERVYVHSGDWTASQKESRSSYAAPLDQALVGRWHSGDENGPTRYRTGALYWQNRQVRLTGATWTGQYKESSHTTHAPYNQVMTGRLHTGDENGKTQYQYATVTFAG